MNTKTLIYLFIALLTGFTVIVIIIFSIFYFDRTILGFPPPPVDSLQLALDRKQAILDSIEKEKLRFDTVFIEPKIVVTAENYNQFQKHALEQEIARSQNQALERNMSFLLDSIGFWKKYNQKINDSLKTVRSAISSDNQEKKRLLDSISKLSSISKKSQSELEQLRKALSEKVNKSEGKTDSLKMANYQSSAKIYDNTEPASTARILEKMNKKDAAMIIKMMNKKKAGKVLEVMNPDKAAAILKYDEDK